MKLYSNKSKLIGVILYCAFSFILLLLTHKEWLYFVSFIPLFIFLANMHESEKEKEKCANCNNLISLYLEDPTQIVEISRGDSFYKTIEELTGWSESTNQGTISNYNNTDWEDYSGSSTTYHYQYRDILHQMVEYNFLYPCPICKKQIGRAHV